MMTGKAKDDYESSSLNDDASYISNIGRVEPEGASKVEEKNTKTSSERMVLREAQFVQSLRLGLFLVLLAASAIAAGCIYWYLAKTEQAEFEQSFHDLSTKLTEEFHRVAERTFGTIAAFSNSITVYMIVTNATWPFVTIPSYESQVYHVSELGNLVTLAFAPIVEENERKEWEDVFVPQNVNTWVHESLMYPQSYGGYVNETFPSYQMKPAKIENRTVMSTGFFPTLKMLQQKTGVYDDVPTNSGPYLSLWQVSPFVLGQAEAFINQDLNVDPNFDRNVITILREHKSALGKYTKQAYSEVFGNGNPTSIFHLPVLKGLSRTSPVGAGLATIITWLQFFSDILPESAVGMIGVLGNTCNQSFTIRVDGATPTFVGDNDMHESKYDHLKEEVSFLSLINDSFDNKEYLGFPLDETGCVYTLRIYPSSDFQSQYVTNRPVVASVVVLIIFIVTSSLFVMYDRLVERRQRLVQKEATSSGAIVSSLFPAAYRERLMAAQKSNQNETNFYNGDDEGLNPLDHPIADMYRDCTVLFADITGFTNWSATRDPVQVFCLLQGVFAAIDKVAKKLRVFKVETIGDCYMAVTGLPNPQTNHAQLMSRFATESIIQMRETVSCLAKRLGKDTEQLSLRIGLHSGPVTAGILRGEKSRFQLFGDTVNTASRMESTGAKGRIQVSTTTADLLRQAGKGHWLLQRDDLVEAKGKGTMQTYWLVAVSGSTGSISVGEHDIGDTDVSVNEPTEKYAQLATCGTQVSEILNV